MINELKYLYKELDNLYCEVLYGTTQDYVKKELIDILRYLKCTIEESENG